MQVHWLTLGAGVTPAQGSVKPTAGFTSNQVNCLPNREMGAERAVQCSLDLPHGHCETGICEVTVNGKVCVDMKGM